MTKETRVKRRKRTGVVTSNKMQKTITVTIERRIRHPKYGKVISCFSKIKAHDEKQLASIGDQVEVMECRPLSKTKSWCLVRVIEKGKEQ